MPGLDDTRRLRRMLANDRAKILFATVTFRHALVHAQNAAKVLGTAGLARELAAGGARDRARR